VPHGHLSAEFVEDSEARYATGNRELAVVCLASRPYDEPNGATGYWYGFTPEQRTFLNEATECYLALGCGSPDRLLLVPIKDAEPWLESLNTTEGRHWHIQVFRGADSIELDLPKLGRRVDVSAYQI